MAEDALARAKAIAAKLAGAFASHFFHLYFFLSSNIPKFAPVGTFGGLGASVGDKRKWDENSSTSAAGLGLVQKKKVYVPVAEYPGVNFLGNYI